MSPSFSNAKLSTILNGDCSKLAKNCKLCSFLLCPIQGLHGSDMIQATNWLTDGRAPSLVRHALTALSVDSHP